MPLAILLTATCAGLLLSVIWLASGGSAMTAAAIYVVAGHLAMALLLIPQALRHQR